MMLLFGVVIYLGHLYLCMMVFGFQCMIFRELVGVRKKLTADRKLPLFRFIQWAWFFLASFFTWSDSIVAVLSSRLPFKAGRYKLDGLLGAFLEHHLLVAFGLYS